MSIRDLAAKYGLKDHEEANVGVIIGFIVSAIIMAMGVVKLSFW